VTAADGVLLVIISSLTAYALLAGADFGGGVWDLLARGRHAKDERRLISGSLGPVWEANHVWLIFVIVATFSGFPAAFGLIARTLELPLAFALAGIVLRGAGYVYRAYGEGAYGPEETGTAWWGRVFAVASTSTPFMLGVCGAALATGKLHTAPMSSPLVPFQSAFTLVSGLFAVAVTAFLAAVYLCHDAAGSPETAHLVPGFRRKALGAAAVAGVLSLVLLPLLAHDAPVVAQRFRDRSIPFLALAALAGTVSLAVIWQRRYVLARVTGALAVGGVLWGWALAQYPDLAVGAATAAGTAAAGPNLRALLIAMGFGMAVILPAFVLLLRVFATPEPGGDAH
jgi:cytochrome d ubiquinol oxidase subunit II